LTALSLGVGDPPVVSAVAPVPLLACGIVLAFTAVALCGVKWLMRLAMPNRHGIGGPGVPVGR